MRRDLEKARAYSREYYKRNRDRILDGVKHRKVTFRERVAEAQRNSARRARLEMVKEYGGRCVCCGESQPQFLTMDHTNGDGAEHRRGLTGGAERSGGGYQIALWLKRQGWPKDGFRLLCWNCNCAKGFSGYCHPQLVQEAGA